MIMVRPPIKTIPNTWHTPVCIDGEMHVVIERALYPPVKNEEGRVLRFRVCDAYAVSYTEYAEGTSAHTFAWGPIICPACVAWMAQSNREDEPMTGPI